MFEKCREYFSNIYIMDKNDMIMQFYSKVFGIPIRRVLFNINSSSYIGYSVIFDLQVWKDSNFVLFLLPNEDIWGIIAPFVVSHSWKLSIM